MNLLIYVITLILVIAALSYQSLDRYKQGAYLRIALSHRLRMESICDFNQLVMEANRSLKRSNARTAEKSEEEPEQGSDGLSRINFRYLIDPDFYKANPDKIPLMTSILKKLLDTMYGNQLTYQRTMKERPNALEELLTTLREENKELGKKGVKNVKNLGKFKVQDTILRDFWYQLLKPNPMDLNAMKIILQKPSNEIDMNEACIEYSLEDFLSQGNKVMLRVYLAPPLLLYAILKDEAAVSEVLRQRQDIYNRFTKETANELSNEFKTFCQQYSEMNSLTPILDFKVTGTNPKSYE